MNSWVVWGAIALIVVFVVWAIVGAYRYGTRTIRPEDYEE